MPRKPAIKEACDACRRRKVKCNAQRPCSSCIDAALVCRATGVRRKKGRQGATANVLRELRSAPSPVAPNDNSSLLSSPSPQSPQGLLLGAGCHFTRQPGLLDQARVQSCAQYFFSRMLGTVPILHPRTFQRHVDGMHECIHSYCLVTAFCAFVLTQTGYASCHTPEKSSLDLGRALLDEALAAQRHLDPFSAPVRYGITIAFLLYGCQIGMGNQRHAYYFLREATTLYTAGMLDQPGVDEAEADPASSGNLFYLLLVSERAHAIRRHRPITLQITPESPLLESTESDPSSLGFHCLVELYRLFDQSFLSRWNGTETAYSRESLVLLEKHLQQAVPADLDLPDILLADLRVSQQWLRTMIWQLATTAGFLSSTPSHPSLDFRYPLQIARDLSLATWKLSRGSMETHGVGLTEKIFEVACTLTDVMTCLPSTGLRSSTFDLGPQDYLKHLFSLLNDLPGGQKKFLPLLLAKVGQTLPSMLTPVSRHLSLPVSGLERLNEDASSPGTGVAGDWAKGFNWAGMSRIGDTPEMDG